MTSKNAKRSWMGQNGLNKVLAFADDNLLKAKLS
jgi:hypothetical protein